VIEQPVHRCLAVGVAVVCMGLFGGVGAHQVVVGEPAGSAFLEQVRMGQRIQQRPVPPTMHEVDKTKAVAQSAMVPPGWVGSLVVGGGAGEAGRPCRMVCVRARGPSLRRVPQLGARCDRDR
jgi:hypothetical protein